MLERVIRARARFLIIIFTCRKHVDTYFELQAVQHERLVKLIYIHMLGYDASFGVIDAIKFAQQSSLFYKRVGKRLSYLLIYYHSTNSVSSGALLQTIFYRMANKMMRLVYLNRLKHRF